MALLGGEFLTWQRDGLNPPDVVKAATVGTRAYLLFQLDESAEQLRQVLQAARSDALKRPSGQ